ncbi:MAG: 50S ribosomal protein L20 [Desulfobacterota bacterium]|nr:50S ribosomal protein L20 [Thermodesulfobacteriota bacterium]
MPRVKRGFTLRQRRKRLFKLAKGFRSGRGNLYRLAKESVDRALKFAYRDRRTRKRDFRRLWIARINAAARTCDLSYSQLMFGLRRANIAVNRKILAEMAIADFPSFSRLATIAKEKIG